MSHIVASHLADGSQEWCSLRKLDPEYNRMFLAATQPDMKYDFQSGLILSKKEMEDREPKKEIKAVEFNYKHPNRKVPESFNCIYKFVQHLLEKEKILEYQAIYQAVQNSFSGEEVKEVRKPAEFPKVELMRDASAFEDVQQVGELEGKEAAEVLQELHNYAAKCISDGSFILDHFVNVDVSDVLPGEAQPEPSTDHTSGEKKSGTGDFGATAATRSSRPAVFAPFEADPQLSREAMLRRSRKTAGPSPDRVKSRGIRLQDEPAPRQKDLKLGKRPEREQTPPVMQISKIVHAKPTYVSRGSSPDRGKKIHQRLQELATAQKSEKKLVTQLGPSPLPQTALNGHHKSEASANAQTQVSPHNTTQTCPEPNSPLNHSAHNSLLSHSDPKPDRLLPPRSLEADLHPLKQTQPPAAKSQLKPAPAPVLPKQKTSAQTVELLTVSVPAASGQVEAKKEKGEIDFDRIAKRQIIASKFENSKSQGVMRNLAGSII